MLGWLNMFLAKPKPEVATPTKASNRQNYLQILRLMQLNGATNCNDMLHKIPSDYLSVDAHFANNSYAMRLNDEKDPII